MICTLTSRASLVAALATVFASGALAQTPRLSVQVDPAGSIAATGHSIATHANTSAVAWTDTASNGIYIATSDGSGRTWSSPIRVDTSPTTKFLLDGRSVAVRGSKVFVLWEDHRFDNLLTTPFIESELLLAVYDTATQTLSPEVIVPKGFPLGTNGIVTNSQRYRLSVTEYAGNTVVWVVFSTDDPLTAVHDLVVAVSHDGGATFPLFHNLVTPQSQIDVDDFEFAADDGVGCVAWADNRNIIGGSLDDAFAARSIDGGLTFQAPQQLDASGPLNGDVDASMAVAVAGTTCAVLWQEEAGAGGGTEILHGSVSTGGAFLGDAIVGFYTVGLHDVDGPNVGISANGSVFAAWNDDRTAVDQAYVARSIDSGSNWVESPQLSAAGGGVVNVSPIVDVNHSGITISWQEGAFPNKMVAAYSHDDGVTFDPPVTLSENQAFGSDVDGGYITFNSFYRNYLAVWLEDTSGGGANHVRVGGFRPQTLTANGFVAGNTIANFSFDRFEAANCPLGFVFLSFGLGSTTISNRDLGIAPDPLLFLSVDLATLGALSAPLSNGSGSTIALPATLPSGVTLYAVGLGVDPSTASIRSVTDVVTITLL